MQMKKSILFCVCLTLIMAGLQAQSGNSDSKSSTSSLFNSVKKVVSNSSGSSLSSDEIVKGLKEALTLGAEKSTDKLSMVNGFFKDAVVKILLPEQAQKVEKTLRSVGMGKLVDDAILSLNRAAEDASKTATPIFVNAIKNMSIQDALGILRGT